MNKQQLIKIMQTAFDAYAASGGFWLSDGRALAMLEALEAAGFKYMDSTVQEGVIFLSNEERLRVVKAIDELKK